MAELNVQPKKKSILPWILLLLGIIALLIFLVRGCNHTDSATTNSDSTTTAATRPAVANDTSNNWNDVDFNAPAATYGEITDTNINVRGNNNYGIYSLGENILFDEGKSTIRPNAEKNLKQIAASIAQRYNGGRVRIYGYTDSIGSSGANKDLAQQRAQAVSDWLTSNGNISKDKISLNAVGDKQPVASNATSEGRKLNRRVEIVVKKS